jgi:hypothetical protein
MTIIVTILILIIFFLGYFTLQINSLKERILYLEGKKKPDLISLDPIPKEKTLLDVDPNNNIIKDIMESSEIEDWSYKVAVDNLTFGTAYDVTLSNQLQNLHIKSKIRIREIKRSNKSKLEPYLVFLSVSTNDNAYLSYGDDSIIKNDLVLFIWNYIIKYHNDQNIKIVDSYQKSIISINEKLISLNRDRKLNKII